MWFLLYCIASLQEPDDSASSFFICSGMCLATLLFRQFQADLSWVGPKTTVFIMCSGSNTMIAQRSALWERR